MNTFGQNIRISLFGESHGDALGLIIDGLPSKLKIDIDLIKTNLERRKGLDEISTTRREPDEFRIISGLYQDETTGAPLTIIIPNLDVNSDPYEKGLIRPSHGDLGLYQKFKGANDPRGGGHGSGRITAALVILGSICQSILTSKGVQVVSRIASIKEIKDVRIPNEKTTYLNLAFLQNEPFPVIDQRAKQLMLKAIKNAQKADDSLGGTIETYVFGLNAGIGEPFFDSFESIISHLMFSIPGIKALEFGDGFEMCKKSGKEIIDELSYSTTQNLEFMSNHQGGINGGITNGNYVKFTCGVRAPSSIATPLSSVNCETKENVLVSTIGRHDPAIVHRVLPVIEALTYFAILDLRIEDLKRWQS